MAFCTECNIRYESIQLFLYKAYLNCVMIFSPIVLRYSASSEDPGLATWQAVCTHARNVAMCYCLLSLIIATAKIGNQLLWPTWYTYVLFCNTYITSSTSTCFEHYNAHHQEAQLYHASSGISLPIGYHATHCLKVDFQTVCCMAALVESWLSNSVLHGSQ
jgi:hypothetical protein